MPIVILQECPEWFDASIDEFLGVALTTQLSAVRDLRRVVDETCPNEERKASLLFIIDGKIAEMLPKPDPRVAVWDRLAALTDELNSGSES